MKQTTESFTNWLANSDDDTKLFFAINWKIPHSILNCACRYFKNEDLHDVDWYTISKSKSTLITCTWSRITNNPGIQRKRLK